MSPELVAMVVSQVVWTPGELSMSMTLAASSGDLRLVSYLSKITHVSEEMCLLCSAEEHYHGIVS